MGHVMESAQSSHFSIFYDVSRQAVKIGSGSETVSADARSFLRLKRMRTAGAAGGVELTPALIEQAAWGAVGAALDPQRTVPADAHLDTVFRPRAERIHAQVDFLFFFGERQRRVSNVGVAECLEILDDRQCPIATVARAWLRRVIPCGPSVRCIPGFAST